MRKVVRLHARLLMWALAWPFLLGVACLGIVIIGYFSYRALGTDLLPEMDEGAFVLDYLTPAGTSLSETNRILLHVEQILHNTPR